MRISVVIPGHDTAEHLRRAVRSVMAQGIDGTEIIVVADASSDTTGAAMEQLRRDVPNVRIVKTKGGPARIAGLREAAGEYVAFLDPGDAYGEAVLAKALSALDDAPWIEAIDLGETGSRASDLIVRRAFAQGAGGFLETSGDTAAFRAAVRAWGNIRRLGDTGLVPMPRAPGDSGGAHSKETAERRRLAAGVLKTRVLHVSDSRNSSFEPFDFETFDTDTSFRHAKETLQGKTYPAIPFLKTPASVLDIGANIGASAVTFALRYPKARIVAVEPARQPFTLLRCNTAKYATVESYNIGLFGMTTKRQLLVGASDSLTNSVVQNRFSSERREDIQLVAADVFAAQMGVTRPDIIKIDTEGCELPILSAMLESVQAAKAIYLEYHSEEDRTAIDRMLGQTHILYFGNVPFPHRGEFVYVRNDAFPSQSERDRWRIGA